MKRANQGRCFCCFVCVNHCSKQREKSCDVVGGVNLKPQQRGGINIHVLLITLLYSVYYVCCSDDWGSFTHRAGT